MNMNIQGLKNRKATLIFLMVFLVVALFSGLYYLVIQPKKAIIEQKESELHMQEKLLSTLQGKTGAESNPDKSVVDLQEMVPVTSLTQQLLLYIEKAEVISGSFVLNMSFEDGELIEEPVQQADGQAVENQMEQSGKVDSQEEEQSNTIPLPASVKKITATLTVESPTYFEFEEFLSVLENSKRIILIESIDFTAGEELMEEEQEPLPLNYQVTFSAFYMPGLTDLLESLPKMQTPEPANKKNPLPTFGEFSNLDQLPINSLVVDPSKKAEEYIVQKGDNLYTLALRFYDSISGIKVIKEANNLNNHIIFIGQKLLIPLLVDDAINEQ